MQEDLSALKTSSGLSNKQTKTKPRKFHVHVQHFKFHIHSLSTTLRHPWDLRNKTARTLNRNGIKVGTAQFRLPIVHTGSVLNRN